MKRKLLFLMTACALLFGGTNAWAGTVNVYLNPGPWNVDNPRYALYMFNDNANEWVNFTNINGTGVYKAEFNDTYTSMIICRMNGNDNTNDFEDNHRWGQTENLSAPTSDIIYTITSIDNNSYTTSEPASLSDASLTAGKYLFKNVATGKYLGPANDWGTRASLVEPTYSNTIETVPAGGYKIESQVEHDGGHYLGINNAGELYLDNPGITIHIKEQSAGVYVMSVDDEISFIGYSGNNTALVHNLLDPSNTNAQWEIISVNDATAISAALSGASTASPKDATFLIGDANFDANSRFSWSGTSMTKGGNNHNYNVELWNGTTDSSFDMFQNLINMPNGLYKLTCQGFYRPGGDDATDATTRHAILYAGSKEARIMNINKLARTSQGDGYNRNVNNTGKYTPNNKADASTVFSAGAYSDNSLYVFVSDGTLKIGMKKTSTIQNDWTCFDNFRLYYCGPQTAEPADMTFMINNPSFETGDMTGWTTYNQNNVVAPSSLSDTGVKPVGTYALTNSDGYYIMNYYGWSWSCDPFNGIQQTIPDMPAGKYRIEAVIGGWANSWEYQLDVNGTYQKQTPTANDQGLPFSVNVELAEKGDLVITAKTYHTNSNAWEACFLKADNFRLYYGNSVAAYAPVAFTSAVATAGKWYAYTVGTTGGYLISSEGNHTMYYTQDPTVDADTGVSNCSISSTATCTTLEAGTFYFKIDGSGNDAFTITPCTYDLSEATMTTSIAANDYLQELTTFTVDFPDAATDDANASLAVIGTPVATLTNSGSTVATSATLTNSGTALTATFSGVTLTPGATYNISIPAGVFGYAGHAENSAISIDFNTPAVFNGTYYLCDATVATNKLFLGRGADWGTRATVDKYGVPFNLVTNSSNESSIEFVDLTGSYLFLNGNSEIYTDGGTSPAWVFEAAPNGKYNLKTGTNYTVSSGTSDDFITLNANSASATAWTVMSVEDHDAIVDAYPTTNINNVITASGISTTEASFESYLTSNYYADDSKTSLISYPPTESGSGWTWSGYRGDPTYSEPWAQIHKISGKYTYTIPKSSLPAGIYKVEMSGFDRRTSVAGESSLYKTYPHLSASYLKVNNEQVRIMSSVDMFANGGSEYEGDGKHSWYYQTKALNEGHAREAVYVYLDGNTDLVITIEKPDYNGGDSENGSVLVFGDFKLTYYQEKVAINETENYTPVDKSNAYVTLNRSFANGNWNTFCVPFDITNAELQEAFGNDVKVAVYTAVPSSNPNVTIVSFDESAGANIAANTPVLLKTTLSGSQEISFPNRTIVAPSGTPQVTGDHGYDFVGSYDAETEIASGNYIISNNNLVQSTGASKIRGTRAYIKAKPTTPNNARIGSFFIDGVETTGIDGLELNPAETGNIYNLNGQRVENAKKGLYIQNGKKVVIK